MIRVYLDSNIFRYIKPKHKLYNRELHSLIDSLVRKVLFIYSGTHLDDLKDSPENFRQEDLQHMGQYVGDNYFFRDPIKNITTCLRAKPLDAYNSIDYETMSKFLNGEDVIKQLTDDLSDSNEDQQLKNIIDSMFNLPMKAFGDTIDTSKLEGANKEWFDRMLPNYSPDMNLKDFMNSMMPYGSKLLTEASEVKELRGYMEAQVKSDSYNYQNWGMQFNEKIKEKLGKTFLEFIDGILLEKQKSDFFVRFNYAYTFLEMFNITKEKSGKKTKQFNYWSLSNDSNHCYFGSLCDYLVTDDKGLQVKASILYNLFNIETKILSSSDFITERKNFPEKENTTTEFIQRLHFNIKNSELISLQTIIENRDVVGYYKIKQAQLNVFDYLIIVSPQSNKYRKCILSFERPPNDSKIILMYSEIELVVQSLVSIFGNDNQGKGVFDSKEEFKNGEALRTWAIGDTIFYLLFNERDRWLQIELHIYFPI